MRQSVRRTLFSLLACGIQSNGIYPITAAKLYIYIVPQRALFGWELWNNITLTYMAHLEATHNFWLRLLQNLPMSTCSDTVKGLLGFTSFSGYIDLQTLSWMGSLCRLKPMDFKKKYTSTNNCFIQKIMTILQKYNLEHFIEQLISNGTFPSKNM